MENIRQLYSYGDMPPWGEGPEQGPIYDGPEYITKNFPKLDRFEICTVERQRPEDADSEQEKNIEAGIPKKHPTPEQAKAILEQMEQDKRLRDAEQGERMTNSNGGNENGTITHDSIMTTSARMGVGVVLVLLVLMMLMFQRNAKKQKAAGKAN